MVHVIWCDAMNWKRKRLPVATLLFSRIRNEKPLRHPCNGTTYWRRSHVNEENEENERVKVRDAGSWKLEDEQNAKREKRKDRATLARDIRRHWLFCVGNGLNLLVCWQQSHKELIESEYGAYVHCFHVTYFRQHNEHTFNRERDQREYIFHYHIEVPNYVRLLLHGELMRQLDYYILHTKTATTW